MVDSNQLLPSIVAERARSEPERVFLQTVTGGTFTYGQLHAGSAAWTAAYHRAGIGPGDPVVSMMAMRFEFYESWLGLAALRGIDTPINTDYRGAMLRHALETASPKLVVVEARFLERLAEVAAELDLAPTVVVLDADVAPAGPWATVTAADFLAGAAPVEGLEPVEAWDLATIVFTSGTTGPSKGVMMPWGQLHALATGAFPLEDLGPDDAFYLPVVTYHMGAKAMPLLMALVGGRVVIRERFSATEFLSDIEAFQCTITVMVAAIAQIISSADPKPTDADTPLRCTLMAPVVADVEQFSERFGVRVATAYGMTELAPVIGSDGWGVTNANHASCGRVRPGYEVRVVDDHDQEVPVGEVGELIVRADQPWTLNQGYFRMPEATVRAWRNGWFHTGDGFRRDAAGDLYFVDRLKDAIRRRGENISSFEVEGIVATHPEVAQAAAVAVPSELNEDEVKVVVVRVPGSTLTEAELHDHLVQVMPRFMLPRYIEFTSELPRTPTERIKKIKLREAGITPATWDREA